jgi:hypothetical protein
MTEGKADGKRYTMQPLCLKWLLFRPSSHLQQGFYLLLNRGFNRRLQLRRLLVNYYKILTYLKILFPPVPPAAEEGTGGIIGVLKIEPQKEKRESD